jgi:hypothetical protein
VPHHRTPDHSFTFPRYYLYAQTPFSLSPLQLLITHHLPCSLCGCSSPVQFTSRVGSLPTSASLGPSSALTTIATTASSAPEPRQWTGAGECPGYWSAVCELACKVLCAFTAVGSVVGWRSGWPHRAAWCAAPASAPLSSPSRSPSHRETSGTPATPPSGASSSWYALAV